ncbi:MAG: hypothetical protein IJC59_00680 [Lachnospiraceae bacterium]|nr:hypothetical protein [Lachnospiraceae bacterium]
MEKDREEAILAFDTIYTNNHMKMMKLLLPYLKQEHQIKAAIYIKWQELLYTIRFSHHHDTLCRQEINNSKEPDLPSLVPSLMPYCSENEKQVLSRFTQMQNMMNTYKDILQYLPLLQQMQSDRSDPMEMMKAFMSPEQMEMFGAFMEGGLED